ncbi:MAG: gluconate kinase, partial [Gammaproteobacteria bacterium]|nr:gluconate kinase [Gammaproteobacteria bacterium]
MSNYLGIDIGTGSCKAAILDSSGTIHGIGSQSYFSDSQSVHWKEQNPDAIVDGMIGAVKDVFLKTDQSLLNINAVSLGCALHGIMAVDKEGNPLTNLYTWADDRAERQARRIKASSDYFELYRQTGCPAHGMYPLYKIMWIRENLPQVFSRTAKFISIKEYILQKLCGEFLIDFSVASGSGLFNVHSHQWNPLSLKLAGIDRQQLSALASPWMMKSITSPSMAEELGLPLHTPIVLGASDAANSSLGAGAFSNTQATCMIGTSGAYRIISPEPLLHPKASSWCYCVDDSHWLVGGAIN